ncbi:MAG: 2-oxoacid:acceptor oxidoreductase family protein [Candidatus Omnitrophica bacterium]|nr:2-oxoacid:acceptor oxidoreductase family protein [Candidatus Omnitrophota bacterium]
MNDLLEIRWHGRGGQGAVTAAKILAESALLDGKFIQAFPEYGPERAGAPVRSYTRISSSPIYIHSQVTDPKIVVVLDPTLLEVTDVTEGLPEDGTIIINTNESPRDLRSRVNIKARKIFTVSATDIAIKELKRNIPNTPMIAALLKVTGLLDIEMVMKNFKEKYSKKFNAEIIEGNLRAMKTAFESVKSE